MSEVYDLRLRIQRIGGNSTSVIIDSTKDGKKQGIQQAISDDDARTLRIDARTWFRLVVLRKMELDAYEKDMLENAFARALIAQRGKTDYTLADLAGYAITNDAQGTEAPKEAPNADE